MPNLTRFRDESFESLTATQSFPSNFQDALLILTLVSEKFNFLPGKSRNSLFCGMLEMRPIVLICTVQHFLN